MLNTYPNDNNYPTPSFDQPVTSPDVDPDAGDLVSASFNADWIPVMEGALDSLLLPSTWAGTHDEINLALNRSALLKDIIAQASVRSVDTPYWDDATDVDDEMTVDEQPWYGKVLDPALPPNELTFIEDATIWVFTGLLAIATVELGFAPAIAFRTIAPKFVLAVRQGDLGRVIRLYVDGAETYSFTDDGSETIVEVPVLGDPELDDHQIYITSGDA